MLRPAVLIDGLAAGTWGLGSKQRTVTIDWFRRPAESAELSAALRAERASVEGFPGS